MGERVDVAELLRTVLEQAAAAHHRYEEETGGPDADWARWYAGHMAQALAEGGYRIELEGA